METASRFHFSHNQEITLNRITVIPLLDGQTKSRNSIPPVVFLPEAKTPLHHLLSQFNLSARVFKFKPIHHAGKRKVARRLRHFFLSLPESEGDLSGQEEKPPLLWRESRSCKPWPGPNSPPGHVCSFTHRESGKGIIGLAPVCKRN